jgi:hypothetical protein
MKLVLLILLALPGLSLAADVKINSFVFLGQKSSAAEICGTVLALTGHPEMIKIIVDPNTKNPGSYYVWSGADGKFCSIVSTFSGQADAFLEK